MIAHEFPARTVGEAGILASGNSLTYSGGKSGLHSGGDGETVLAENCFVSADFTNPN
jgi:hypothetical protein